MKKVCLALLVVMVISGAASAMTSHTVRTGDTLWDLAQKHYGDGTLYTILAEVNNISNPRTIPNGFVLKIPNKSDLEAIRNETNQEARANKISQINNTGSGSSPNPSDNKKKGYVPPTPEETTFEYILNKSINPKYLKSIKSNKVSSQNLILED